MYRDLADLPGADVALAFLGDAYRTRRTRPGRTIEHPLAVARLSAEDGQRPLVVRAWMLHDILEDTETNTW